MFLVSLEAPKHKIFSSLQVFWEEWATRHWMYCSFTRSARCLLRVTGLRCDRVRFCWWYRLRLKASSQFEEGVSSRLKCCWWNVKRFVGFSPLLMSNYIVVLHAKTNRDWTWFARLSIHKALSSTMQNLSETVGLRVTIGRLSSAEMQKCSIRLSF